MGRALTPSQKGGLASLPDCLLRAGSGEPAIPIAAITKDSLPELEGQAIQWVSATAFTAAAGEVALIPNADGGIAMVLFGLGARGSPDAVPLLPGELPA